MPFLTEVRGWWQRSTTRSMVRLLCAVSLFTYTGEVKAFETGFELMKASSRGNEFRAYVSGIMEGHMLTARLFGISQVACPDPETTREELAGVVLLYLTKNPERLNMQARALVFAALIEQYPCK